MLIAPSRKYLHGSERSRWYLYYKKWVFKQEHLRDNFIQYIYLSTLLVPRVPHFGLQVLQVCLVRLAGLANIPMGTVCSLIYLLHLIYFSII